MSNEEPKRDPTASLTRKESRKRKYHEKTKDPNSTPIDAKFEKMDLRSKKDKRLKVMNFDISRYGQAVDQDPFADPREI